MLQDGGRAVMVDKEEIQRVVSSCNDFAEAEKRSKHIFFLYVPAGKLLKLHMERLYSITQYI